MNEPKGIVTSHVIELLEEGLTLSEIADLYNTTRQTIKYHADKAGWVSPQERVRQRLPWTGLVSEDRHSPAYQGVYNHLMYAETGGVGMSDDQLRRLRDFYDNKLTRWVVEFDPDVQPYPGMQMGRWHYPLREERDGDLILRINQYTNIPEHDLGWFRRLTRLPEI